MEIEHAITFRGCYLEVKAEVENCSVGNDGIGAYEYWGIRGYDKGTDFVEDFNITDIVVTNYEKPHLIKGRLFKALDRELSKDNRFTEKVDKEFFEYYADSREPDDYDNYDNG